MPEHCAHATCYEQVRFRDLPALFTSLRVGSVPDGMYRYEIRMDEDSSEPCQIARHILVNHYGTLLTTDPIQLSADGYLNFSGEELVFSGDPPITADGFQKCHPSSGQDVLELYPMREEERDLFFSSLDTEDPSLGCIGHVRGDFDRGSGVLYTTWWPHVWNDPLNTPEFAAHLEKTIHWLRTGFSPLKNLELMDAFCSRYEHARIPGQTERCYGFRVESARYRYMLRCTPLQGWYHLYLYCYSKEHMKQSPSECKEVNVHGA